MVLCFRLFDVKVRWCVMTRTTKFYRKNEREVMKRLGFKPTKNSGSGWVQRKKMDRANSVSAS